MKVPSGSMAMVPPRISGRASCSASMGCDMNVRNRSGSRQPALDHLDEAGVVGAAVEEHHHVVAVVEGDLALEALLHLLPPLALLGRGGVLRRGLARLEPYDGHELAVVGDAVGTAQPACCGGSEGVAPFITELVEPGRVAALTLDDLDEHRTPSPPRGRPLLGGAGETLRPETGSGTGWCRPVRYAWEGRLREPAECRISPTNGAVWTQPQPILRSGRSACLAPRTGPNSPPGSVGRSPGCSRRSRAAWSWCWVLPSRR